MRAAARAVALLAALLVLGPRASQAVFHLAVIDEVMSGAAGNPNLQYVEIRMLAGSQNFVSHSRLSVFKCSADGGGFSVLIDDVPANVANSGAGVRWLMASPDAAAFLAASGKSPDFTWDSSATGSVPTACGMVCWGAPGFVPPNPPTWDASSPAKYVDCVAYGPYDGTAQPLGNPAATATPGDGTMSLTRTGMEMFSNNFALACPSPTNNASMTPGGFGPCGSATTTTTTIPPGAGQPIAGTKLLLKANPNKPAKNALVLLAKDTGIRAGDPTELGGSLHVSTTAGDAFDTSYPLAASGWKPIGKPGAPKGYRFKDAAGPIKLVIVKPGKMAKAVGKGSGLGHTLGANPDPVTVLLAIGTERDCMSFGGGKFVAGKKYLATHVPAPAACP